MFEQQLLSLLKQYDTNQIILGFVLLSATGHFILHLILNSLRKHSLATSNHWDDTLFDALGPPLKWGWCFLIYGLLD